MTQENVIVNMDKMKPAEIVAELDKYVVGQKEAKKAVAIALRNRYRRMMLDEKFRDEVTPKNIMLIGTTGVGKTEIARRIAKLTRSPFIKVEASKYTEVGYVGRDVESMVRDLVDIAFKMVQKDREEEVQEIAKQNTEEKLLDMLLPNTGYGDSSSNDTREKFREMLRAGKLEDREIEVELEDSKQPPHMEVFSNLGLEDMSQNIQDMMKNMFSQKTKKKLKVSEARDVIKQNEVKTLVEREDLRSVAIEKVERQGIIFIDEIDKICSSDEKRGGEVSREGVQRDLLPLVEGSTVSTKYGRVSTDHILFMAAGAFHIAKPSDLIPELQGRFPIRVNLESLTVDDFIRILSEPENAITKQYVELLKTEGVQIDFDETGIKAIAEMANEVNSNVENIGARRLHTIMEKLLEDILFDAPDVASKNIVINREFAMSKLDGIVKNKDLSRYVL